MFNLSFEQDPTKHLFRSDPECNGECPTSESVRFCESVYQTATIICGNVFCSNRRVYLMVALTNVNED